jgi:predicted deacylase
MGRAIELHVFPGRSSHSALVIAGVHGTEFVGVDLARRLLARLRADRGLNARPYFTTIVVPALFPDNLPASHGGDGHARRATRGRVDPNRQFPAIGTAIDASVSSFGNESVSPVLKDARDRPIERANVALMNLIHRCRPCRIASVHAIQKPSSVGIYSDPHPDAGTDLAAETGDLAERIHVITKRLGGQVPGSPSACAKYPHQDSVDHQGVSLGTWASRAIETGPHRRDPIPVITLELKRDWPPRQARQRRRHVEAFMLAIRQGFLEPWSS